MPSNKTEHTAGDITFRWASQIIAALRSCGIVHFVISPGSRSTPLTMAASAQQSLKKHVVLDERSAGFIALGIGKKIGIPAALICTSGTAAANYYPAVIEAGKSAVPLIILSADRPPELQGTGANQTINQRQLYGNYGQFYDTGIAKESEQDIKLLASEISSLVMQSIKQRNPLQINVPLAKPLEPTRSFYKNFNIDEELVANITQPQPDDEDLTNNYPPLSDDVCDQILEAEQPVIIAGHQQCFDTAGRFVPDLAEKLDAPVLAEATSHLGTKDNDQIISGFNTFLQSEIIRKKLTPDLIISTGDAWVGKGLLQYFEEHKNKFHIHITSSGVPQNPSHSVNYTFHSTQIDSNIIGNPGKRDPEWLTKWQKLSEQYKNQTQSVLEREHTFTDLHAFDSLLPLIPEVYQVFTGNSLPIRDLDRFSGMYQLNSPLFANRGASGIDGNISTAMGIGIASNSPVVAITGDLTFLHDSNALLSARLISNPFIVVIINNGGGSIFNMLPVTEFPELMEPYFTTPQAADIKALAEVYKLPYHAVEDTEALKMAVESARSRSGISLVECKTDAKSSMRLRNNLWQHNWHEYID